MKILTNGPITTADGVTHSNPVAVVGYLTVSPMVKQASAEFRIFHNISTISAQPIKQITYTFGDVEEITDGVHPFNAVFAPTLENPDPGVSGFFNYIKSLPEWEGWTEV